MSGTGFGSVASPVIVNALEVVEKTVILHPLTAKGAENSHRETSSTQGRANFRDHFPVTLRPLHFEEEVYPRAYRQNPQIKGQKLKAKKMVGCSTCSGSMEQVLKFE